MGILWNPWEVNFSGFVATPFSHSVEFHILGTRIKGFMTNVYGPPREEHKLSTRLPMTNHGSWVEIST